MFGCNRSKLRSSIHIRRYSTFTPTLLSKSTNNLPSPVPIKIFNNLDNNKTVISYGNILRKKAGIYCFINTINNKRYIGSAKDLYFRLIEHLSNKKSNSALQSAIAKYGLEKFYLLCL